MAIAVSKFRWSPDCVFWLNLVALLPLFGAFRYSTEVLSAAASPNVGRVWDSTLGAFNLDLAIAFIGIWRGQLIFAKSYIVGKVVASTLWSTGVCFVASGVRSAESSFDETMSHTLGNLLATAMVPFAILSVFPQTENHPPSTSSVLIISRGSSVVFLTIYSFYQLFRHKTHTAFFDPELFVDSQDEESSQQRRRPSSDIRDLGGWVTSVTIIGAATLGYVCSTLALRSMHESTSLTEEVVGFCLIPLLGEISEITKLSRFAYRDRVDFALEKAAGLAVQTMLFIGPLLCLFSWSLGQAMTFRLDLLELASLMASIYLFNGILRDGKSNYLEGALCLGLYAIETLALVVRSRK
ncbi:unnamed protein product [Zymoseptoria tritici ST99CH_3D7]|uniref:Sodium/calcium exchanger membrane region domain-containing protein n=2 Tax=Zymoseptoria tritici TaxID=1047171 RepID=A0A1X7S8T4_ZYMT9|nr:unnamed protein product [Zymoseptoria tritici ST99CH_3D7]